MDYLLYYWNRAFLLGSRTRFLFCISCITSAWIWICPKCYHEMENISSVDSSLRTQNDLCGHAHTLSQSNRRTGEDSFIKDQGHELKPHLLQFSTFQWSYDRLKGLLCYRTKSIVSIVFFVGHNNNTTTTTTTTPTTKSERQRKLSCTKHN
jgi:hypothetical protein